MTHHENDDNTTKNGRSQLQPEDKPTLDNHSLAAMTGQVNLANGDRAVMTDRGARRADGLPGSTKYTGLSGPSQQSDLAYWTLFCNAMQAAHADNPGSPLLGPHALGNLRVLHLRATNSLGANEDDFPMPAFAQIESQYRKFIDNEGTPPGEQTPQTNGSHFLDLENILDELAEKYARYQRVTMGNLHEVLRKAVANRNLSRPEGNKLRLPSKESFNRELRLRQPGRRIHEQRRR